MVETIIVSILVSMVLANGEIKSAYEWFNGFMGLVLGVLGGTFALGIFTKRSNTFGAVVAFAVAAILMIIIKYCFPAISIWSYSIISIGVSLVIGYPASLLYTAVHGNKYPSSDYATALYKGTKEVQP